MKLSIVIIQNQGDREKEVIMLKAEEDLNLRNYIVTEGKITRDDVLSTSFQNTHWFRAKEVKAGDFVLLYTREGTEGDKVNEDGATLHFCHWGADHPIWNETEDAAVVLELNSWVSEKTRSFVSFV